MQLTTLDSLLTELEQAQVSIQTRSQDIEAALAVLKPLADRDVRLRALPAPPLVEVLARLLKFGPQSPKTLLAQVRTQGYPEATYTVVYSGLKRLRQKGRVTKHGSTWSLRAE